MFDALARPAILAATVFAVSQGAVGTASALSIELAPGVEQVQRCHDRPVTVTKHVQVVRHGEWVTVPRTFTVTRTVCRNHYTKAPVHRHGKPRPSHHAPAHHTPSHGY